MLTPRQNAKKLLTKLETGDPIELAATLHILVLELPLQGVRGFYQQVERTHIIYLSDSLTEGERAFVCAHELGHFLLHRSLNRVFLDSHTLQLTGRYESQADQFAAELLFPDEVLGEYLEFTVSQISDALGLSEELVIYRLATFGQ